MITQPDLATLRVSHPRTFAAFEAMGVVERLHSVAALDQRWAHIAQGRLPDQPLHQQVDRLPQMEDAWDLIYAGGGLGLLHALVMRRHGYRVLIFDRDEVGRAQREWNVSESELRAFVHLGIFGEEELEQIVAHRHARGVVRFHAESIAVQPAELWMDHVLDVSLDAAALLGILRRKLEQAGGEILDHTALEHVLAGPDGVVVDITGRDGTRRSLRGRLLLDGMGATSPLALQRFKGHPFAGVCPTVGSTVSGLEPGNALRQHDPAVGDILISVADAQGGRQLIWEGFAGHDDELTIYVFYYDLVQPDAHHSLLDLFEQYFTLLPTYKTPGPEFRHIKPVFGFIPARHTQRRTSVLPLAGVLPLGDAAAQQSPLTFTGFGSHLRNLERTTSLLDYALRRNLLDPAALAQISAYQANVALHWVFSRFMQPWGRPNDVNRLQNVFARVLNELGMEIAVRFFKDQMRWHDYGLIVNHTLKIYKPIIPTALAVLGPRDTIRWIVDYLRFSQAALLAAGGRLLDERQWYGLERLADRVAPRCALWLKSRRAEWRAMGWLAD